jgi:hypothetical protein
MATSCLVDDMQKLHLHEQHVRMHASYSSVPSSSCSGSYNNVLDHLRAGSPYQSDVQVSRTKLQLKIQIPDSFTDDSCSDSGLRWSPPGFQDIQLSLLRPS